MMGCRPGLPIDLLFPTSRSLPGQKGIHKYVNVLYSRLKEAIRLTRRSAAEDTSRHKRLYDHRAGSVELRPGDKVLVRLDAFRGQRRKLKNRWGADLHTLVCRLADGIPAYEIRNERTGKHMTIHQARLLLWEAFVEPGEAVQISTEPFATPLAVLGLEPASLDACEYRVPREWAITGYGLDLATFKPLIGAPAPETGATAPATPAETLHECGVGQRDELSRETTSTNSDTIHAEDALYTDDPST